MRLATRFMLCAVLGLSTALAACESGGDDGGGGTTPKTDAVSSADPGPAGTDTTEVPDVPVAENDSTDPPKDDGGTEDPGPAGDDIPTPPKDDGPPLTCDLPTAFPGGTAHVTNLEFVDPAKLDELQCDSNNDGKSDATDVSLNTALTTGLAATLDLGGSLKKSIQDYSLIFLLQMEGYAGADATGITTNLMLGSKLEEQPDPKCDDIATADMCEWNINPKTSFDNDCKPLVSMKESKVAAGKLDAGPQDISLAITFAGNTVSLEVKTARLNGETSGSVDLKGGRLCGTVTKQSVLDGLNNACNVEGEKPTWCSYITLIPAILTCDPCGIALKLDAKATKGLKLGPQPQ